MTIPIGSQYMQAEGGLGRLANYQASQADSRVVGIEPIRFGQAVESDENTAVPYKGGNFFGVAIARNWVPEITGSEKEGLFKQCEMVTILRKGTIWIKVDEDVKMGELAKVNTSGNFGVADTGESIGIFQSTAHENGLAKLQINLP